MAATLTSKTALTGDYVPVPFAHELVDLSGVGTGPWALAVVAIDPNALTTILPASISGTITNPSSTISMTSATTAYTAGQMIANNAAGTSVTVPSFRIQNSGGGASIQAIRINLNDATSTAWGGQTIQIDLWDTAPTFATANGDRGAFLVATGSARHLRTFVGTLSAVQTDGVYGECNPTISNGLIVAGFTTIFWTAMAYSGSGVTGASKILTIKPEILN